MKEEIITNKMTSYRSISKLGVGKDHGKNGERKIIYNEMTSD